VCPSVQCRHLGCVARGCGVCRGPGFRALHAVAPPHLCRRPRALHARRRLYPAAAAATAAADTATGARATITAAAAEAGSGGAGAAGRALTRAPPPGWRRFFTRARARSWAASHPQQQPRHWSWCRARLWRRCRRPRTLIRPRTHERLRSRARPRARGAWCSERLDRASQRSRARARVNEPRPTCPCFCPSRFHNSYRFARDRARWCCRLA
jgi:hypothetical protein